MMTGCLFTRTVATLACLLILTACGESSSKTQDLLEDETDDEFASIADGFLPVGQPSEETLDPATPIEPLLEDEQSSTPQITTQNMETVLRMAVEALNLTSLDEDAQSIQALSAELLAGHRAESLAEKGLTLVSQTLINPGDGTSGLRLRYSCDAGGSLIFPDYGQRTSLGEYALSFDNCAVGTKMYDGDFLYEKLRDFAISTFNNFTATHADGSQFSINGRSSLVFSRRPLDNSDAWQDADYIKISNTGMELRLTGIRRKRTVRVFTYIEQDEDFVAGYASLADGSVGLVSAQDNNASVIASLRLGNATATSGAITVASNLSFDGDHYIWNTSNPDARNNFVVPDFPVSELGSPLVLETPVGNPDGTSSLTVDSRAAVADGMEQWNSGALTVESADGSKVVMRPSAQDPTMVEIELNDSGDISMQPWSAGFQVQCLMFSGCQ